MSEVGTHGGRREGAGRPPGALNRLTRPVKELASDQGPASIARLVQLRDEAESEQVRFAAAKELLDRAYGRTRQEVDVNTGKTVNVILRRWADPPEPLTDADGSESGGTSPAVLPQEPALLTHEEGTDE